MARGNLGYGDQRDLHDDIANQMDGEPSTLYGLATELGEAHEVMRRQLNDMQDEGLIVIDKEEPDWLITPAE